MNEQVNIPETGRFNGISMPTKWNDTSFRSRLEARWAIFFDTMRPKIPYEYEPELIATPWGAYLPDFWLPTLRTFFIVKPDMISKEEEAKVAWLAEQGFGAFIAEGPIPKTFSLNGGWSIDFVGQELYEPRGGGQWLFNPSGVHWDNQVTFCQCSKCGIVGIVWSGLADRLCECSGDNRNYGRRDLLERALANARNHRFDNRD